jgi:hypothetical protein
MFAFIFFYISIVFIIYFRRAHESVDLVGRTLSVPLFFRYTLKTKGQAERLQIATRILRIFSAMLKVAFVLIYVMEENSSSIQKLQHFFLFLLVLEIFIKSTLFNGTYNFIEKTLRLNHEIFWLVNLLILLQFSVVFNDESRNHYAESLFVMGYLLLGVAAQNSLFEIFEEVARIITGSYLMVLFLNYQKESSYSVLILIICAILVVKFLLQLFVGKDNVRKKVWWHSTAILFLSLIILAGEIFIAGT